MVWKIVSEMVIKLNPSFRLNKKLIKELEYLQLPTENMKSIDIWSKIFATILELRYCSIVMSELQPSQQHKKGKVIKSLWQHVLWIHVFIDFFSQETLRKPGDPRSNISNWRSDVLFLFVWDFEKASRNSQMKRRSSLTSNDILSNRFGLIITNIYNNALLVMLLGMFIRHICLLFIDFSMSLRCLKRTRWSYIMSLSSSL